jgi:putative ABC transport system permease protein
MRCIVHLNRPLKFKPGDEFEYCNINYELLALLIEHVTNIPYPEYIHQHIFKPAGMVHSYFNALPSAVDTNRVTSYMSATLYASNYTPSDSVKNNRLKQLLRSFKNLMGDGNIISTEEDLLLYSTALFEGKLLNLKTLSLAFIPNHLHADKDYAVYSNAKMGKIHYGLGWEIAADTSCGKIVSHGGHYPGTWTSFVHNITRNQTIITYDNTDWSGADLLSRMVIGILNNKPLINMLSKKNLARQYGQALMKEGADAAFSKLIELKDDTVHYVLREGDMNILGYQFLADHFGSQSLETFKVNALLYPNSSNAYDSYGDALANNNQKEDAVIMYKKSILLDPKNTESTAKRYFGDEDPIGKQLMVNDTVSFMVSAIMKDFPENSHFKADMFISMSTLHGKDYDNWLALGYSNFMLLKKGADANAVQQKLSAIVDKGALPQIEKMLNVHYNNFKESGNAFEMKLQPLTSIHLHSKESYGIDPNTEWGDSRLGNILYVRIFISTALFVLLIAVFNFMNIATAKSEKRAKETGIRKTLGSSRGQLMMQYYTEAVLTTAIAVLAAVIMVKVTLPWFNQLTRKEIELNFFDNAFTLPLLFAFTIFVGIFAGSYPAIFLSAFQPVETLKRPHQKNKTSLRSVLVVGQFGISIALIIGMITVRSQLNFMEKKDLGIKTRQLITIINGSSLGNKLQVFRRELLKNPAVASVTNSSVIFASGVPESVYTYENQTVTNPLHAAFLDVDEYFLSTFGIKMKEGRFFDPSMQTDSSTVVINETAARDFAPDIKSIIGHRITMASNDSVPKVYRIVGVTKDFNFESMHQLVKPLVLHLSGIHQASTDITIKYNGADVANARSYIEGTWDRMQSFEKCNFGFLNDRIANLYSSEKKVSELSTLLSALGILVACLGLLGLAMFVTEQRKKEIGIRKVFGAGVAQVTATISRQFVFWILLANLVAWPVAYLILHHWLQSFAYHISPEWWMFCAAGGLTLLIALITIGTQSIKAALANPVKSLRME